MRADTLTRRMRQLASEQGWQELIRVSRRIGRPGVGSTLWRPWDLFDYMAFDAEGVPLGLRVQRVTVGVHDSYGRVRERDDWRRRIEKRIKTDRKRFKRELGDHPWREYGRAGLVHWTKTRRGNNYELWWEASVRWF